MIRPIHTFWLVAAALVLAGAVAVADMELRYFRVGEHEGVMVVEWESIDETGLRHYEIRRKRAADLDRAPIARIDAHGAGKPYRFDDNSIFKSDADRVTYYLEGVLRDGRRTFLAEQEVSYTSTAVRRTWGSIKAMFQ